MNQLILKIKLGERRNSNFRKLIHALILNGTALVKILINLSSPKEYPGYDYQPSTFMLRLNIKLLKSHMLIQF